MAGAEGDVSGFAHGQYVLKWDSQIVVLAEGPGRNAVFTAERPGKRLVGAETGIERNIKYRRVSVTEPADRVGKLAPANVRHRAVTKLRAEEPRKVVLREMC